MWKPEWTAKVAEFVAAGGTLILSALTGTRGTDNHIHREAAPGAGLSALARATVEEFGRRTGPGSDGLFAPFPSKVNGGHQPAQRLPSSSAAGAYPLTFRNQTFHAAHLYEKLALQPGTQAFGRRRLCDLPRGRWPQALVRAQHHLGPGGDPGPAGQGASRRCQTCGRRLRLAAPGLRDRAAMRKAPQPVLRGQNLTSRRPDRGRASRPRNRRARHCR
jgi:hypothetical protein